MSLETKTRIICDGCGTSIEGKPSHLATRAAWSYWDAIRKAKADGWLTVERPYRRDIHYCRTCADTPQQPIKPPERKKKCQACRELTRQEKLVTAGRVNMGWCRCKDCGWRRTIWKLK